MKEGSIVGDERILNAIVGGTEWSCLKVGVGDVGEGKGLIFIWIEDKQVPGACGTNWNCIIHWIEVEYTIIVIDVIDVCKLKCFENRLRVN